MRVLDLFSGIGGFSLGLERAGMETVAFCEIEEYPRKVLAKHWPDIPIYQDVRELTVDRLRQDGITDIDVLCGGFPCQDISLLGKGAGLDGERSGLWKQYARILGEVQPRYAIMENVSALLGRGLGDILGELAELGFDAEWHCIPAAAVGAASQRNRLWIIAHPPKRPLRPGWFSRLQKSKETHWPRLVSTGGSRADHVIPNWLDRVGSVGNAVVPKIPEIIGRAIMQEEAIRKGIEIVAGMQFGDNRG